MRTGGLKSILSKGMPASVEPKIQELREYQSELSNKHGVPDKNIDWDIFFKRVRELESDPDTWDLAQEFWNLDWILSEFNNIQSSIEQVESCIRESELLSIDYKANL